MVVTTKSTKHVQLSHFEITFSTVTADFLILPSNPCVLAIMTLYGLCTLPLWQAARSVQDIPSAGKAALSLTMGYHPQHHHIRPLPPHRPLLRLPLL